MEIGGSAYHDKMIVTLTLITAMGMGGGENGSRAGEKKLLQEVGEPHLSRGDGGSAARRAQCTAVKLTAIYLTYVQTKSLGYIST